MTVNLGTAYIDIEPDLSGFNSRVAAAMPRVQSSMRGMTTATTGATRTTSALGTATQRAGSALSSAARYAAGAAAAYIGISQAKAAVTTTQDLAKTTLGLSRNLGLSEKAASRWGTVAKARDVDAKSLTMSFTTLSRQLIDASRGSDTAKQAFADLGITQRDLKSTGGDFNKQLLLVADAFGKAEGGAVRQQAAQKLLGRGYQTLLPLFSQGSKGLQEQLHWADEYGTVLKGKTLKAQADLISAQRESKAAWLGLQVTFTQAVTPMLQQANDDFQKLARTMANPDLTDDQKFERLSKMIGQWADRATDAFVAVLPSLVERAGQIAPRIAGALVQGFINAPILGKLALGAWLFKALGGSIAAQAIGTKIGTRVSASAAAAAATSGAATSGWAALGTTAGRLVGPAMGLGIVAMLAADPNVQKAIKKLAGEVLDAPAREEFATKLADSLRVGDEMVKFVGQERVKVRTALGTLILNAETEKVVKTRGKKVADLMGKSYTAAAGLIFQRLSNIAERQNAAALEKSLGGGKFGTSLKAIGQAAKVAAGELGDYARKAGKASKASQEAWQENGKRTGRVFDQVAYGASAAGRVWGEYARDSGKSADKSSKAADKHQGDVDRSLDHVRDDVDRTDDKFSDYARGTDKSTTKASKAAAKMARSVSGSTSSLARAVQGGLENIATNTNEALKAYNVKRLAFSFKKVASGVGNVLGAQRGGAIEQLAMGGLSAFDVPGHGPGDRVPLTVGGRLAAMVEPTEKLFVLNRNASRAYDQLQALNSEVPRFAGGGDATRIVPVPGWPGERANAAIIPALTSFLSRFNLWLSDAYGGYPHVSAEHTQYGTAADVGPQDGDWGKFGATALEYAVRSGYTPVYYDGSHGTTAASNHGPGNHAHVTFLTVAELLAGKSPGGGAAAIVEALKAPKMLGPKGPLRDTGQSAFKKATAAANRYLRSVAPTAGPDTATGGVRALPGGWKRVGATYEGLTGATTPGGTIGGMNWAELLVAGANAGLIGESVTATLGLPMGTYGSPYGTAIQIREPGAKRAYVITKNDNGSGQAGNPYYKVDIQDAIADKLKGRVTQDVDIKAMGRQLGGLVPHLSGGGDGKGDGKPIPIPTPKALGQARRLLKVLRAYTSEAGPIGLIDERIQLAETRAGLESSPGGSELTTAETERQVALYQQLVKRLREARRTAGKGLKLTAQGKRFADKSTRGRLRTIEQEFQQVAWEMSGVTGKGGRIADARFRIDELKSSGTAAPVALDLAGLRSVIEAAQYGVFANLPKFHDGGVVPGPASREVPIMARGGEPVGAAAAPRVQNNVSWDGFGMMIETTVNDVLVNRERFSHRRARQYAGAVG